MMQATEYDLFTARYPRGNGCLCWLGGICSDMGSGRPGPSAECGLQVRETLVDLLSEDAVAIVDQEAVGMLARQRFPELLQGPFRRGMGRYVLVDNLAGPISMTTKT